MVHIFTKRNARPRNVCATAILYTLLVTGVEVRAEAQELWERDKLTAGWGGARAALEGKGVEVGINYIGETLNIVSGGLRSGTAFEGRLDVTVNTDLEKLIGWTGGKSHVRAFLIQAGNNRNAAEYVGSIADPSNIDARPTTRLFTAWFEQEFGNVASLRLGQLAADDEFLVSNTGGGLINGTFGWATIMSANLPSGGPAYPLATPGVRVQIKPSQEFSVLAAAFAGDPAGRYCDDSQVCNRYGTIFSFNGGAFFIAEVQYQASYEKNAKGLAAAYKIGAWYHSAAFADQHFGFDAVGALLTLAAVPDRLLDHRNNGAVYAVIDQMIWRGGERSTSVFARGGFAPSDRNLISWYVDGGVGFKGPIPGRTDDTLTLGVAYSKISKDAIALDQDTLLVNGPPYPIRDAETVFELSYIAQLAPWWTIQPDIQYIVHPGGNVPDPNNPNRKAENAFIAGVRTTISF